MISNEREVKRGDIYYADLVENQIGSVQAGVRPVVIKQGTWLNRSSTTFGVALITSQLKNIGMPTHVLLPKLKGLPKRSMVLGEQQTTVDREQLKTYCCTVSESVMAEIDRAIRNANKTDKHKHKNKRKPRSKSKVRQKKSHH